CDRLRRLVSLVPGRSSLPSHSSKPGLDDVGEHISIIAQFLKVLSLVIAHV
ncbi:unnamed protein product, partial [Musa acuminata var. zebrina]